MAQLASRLRQRGPAEIFDGAARLVGLPTPSPKPYARDAGSLRMADSLAPRERIVAVAHTLGLQGAPISLIEVLQGLRKELDLAVVSSRNGPLAERLQELDIPCTIAVAPQSVSGDSRSYEEGIRRFAAELGALEPALVVANSLATFHAIDAARALGVPSVWVIRESDAPESFFAQYPRGVRARALGCLRYPSLYVFVSRHVMEQWPVRDLPHAFIPTRLEPQRMRNEAQGWTRAEARRRLGLADDEVAFLTVGTLCDDKGQLDVLRALPLVLRRDRRVKLLWLGSPEEPGGRRIERALQAMEPRLRERVDIQSTTSGIGAHFTAADAYLCSSRRECYPRAVLEAQAFGLPVIAAPIGGIPEMLGEGAFWYAPGDPTEMARAITEAAQAARCRERGAPCLRIDQISYERMIDRHVETLKVALANGAA